MGVAPVLALSLLLQFTAALLSLHMVRVTGRRSAWLLIALAIALMGIRRLIALYRVISGDLVHPPDLSAELVSLAISILMVVGIALIAPLFKAARQAGQFRQIVDQVGESILLIDPATGNLVDCNKTACQILGYTRDELLALHISDIVPDRRDEAPEQWRARVTQIQRAGATFLSEGTQQRKDGSTFPVETSIAYRTHDQSAYLVAIARNITERKHLEAELDRQTWELSETSNRLTQQDQLLPPAGRQTLAAATGGQGLSLYRQHQDRVDLILLDLNLPDRTGAEVYAELRNISPVVPIALFTGYVNEQTLPPGESALIIEKPVTLEKLSHSVRMALGESAPVG